MIFFFCVSLSDFGVRVRVACRMSLGVFLPLQILDASKVCNHMASVPVFV